MPGGSEALVARAEPSGLTRVYVVGAVDPAERVLVEQHVSHCLECQAELAGLAGIPALLGRLTLDEIERQPALAPPGGPPSLREPRTWSTGL